MNTNGNLYTVIYSTVLVVLVAAVLAIVSTSLQPKQNENIKMETVTKVLTAATASCNMEVGEGSEVLSEYAGLITSAIYVDGTGNVVGQMNAGKENVAAIEVPTTAYLKRQNDMLKKIEDGDSSLLTQICLPVFVFDIEGSEVTVIPCYGAGLWGPIWGYMALESDGTTFCGAVFDHKSETPGLGAKIAEEPFYSQFAGKKIAQGDVKFSINKGGDGSDPNGVDAISGATITSTALGVSINLWLKYYEPYLKSSSQSCCSPKGGADDEAAACEAEEETANNEEE